MKAKTLFQPRGTLRILLISLLVTGNILISLATMQEKIKLKNLVIIIYSIKDFS